MRSFFSRPAMLALAAAVSLAGCTGNGSTSVPLAGGAADSGGGSGTPVNNLATTPGGATTGQTPRAYTIAPVLIDDGTVAKYTYTATATSGTAADTQDAVQAPPDANPATAPSTGVTPPPSPSDPTDAGSHRIGVTALGGLTTYTLVGPTLPALFYSFPGATNPSGSPSTGQPPPSNIDYTTLVLHAYASPTLNLSGFAYSAATGALTASPIAIELVNVTANFDVRILCSSVAPTVTALGATDTAFIRVNCPLRAYGAFANNSNTFISGPTGAFTPGSGTRIYVLLNAASGKTIGPGTFGLDYVYAFQ